MYIDQVDTIIDDMIEKIYSLVNKTSLNVYKLLEKKNEIIKLDKSIPDNIHKTLSEIMHRYFYIYILLTTKASQEIDENKFSKYLIGLRIRELTPDLVSDIISIYFNIKKIEYLIKNYSNIKSGKVKINLVEYSESIKFLNELGEDIILKLMKKNTIIFDIVKILLIQQNYRSKDRLDIFNILEENTLNKLETKYIEIIDSVIETIDYSFLETVFDPKSSIIDTFMEMYNKINIDLDKETKIKYLFDKKIIIPITDEYLRYHKASEQYSSREEISKNRKIDKISYVANKLNQVGDLYSYRIKENESEKKKIENMFYPPLAYRKVILYNDIEEVNSIFKVLRGQETANKYSDSFNDLSNYRQYAYINFNDFKKNGIEMVFDKVVDAIRSTNFEYKNKLMRSILEWRVISQTKAHIVGIAVIQDNKLIQCIRVRNTKDIRDYTESPFDTIINTIFNFRKTVKNDQLVYWLFDKKLDKFNFEIFDESVNVNGQSNFENYYKNILSILYDRLAIINYNLILEEINKYDYISIEDTLNIVHKYNTKYVPISENDLYKLLKLVIYNKSDKISTADPILTRNKIKLPSIKVIADDTKKIRLFDKNIKIVDVDNDYIDNIAICQHNLTWNNINRFRNDTKTFNQLLNEFKNRFIIVDPVENDFVCKSCYEPIPIKKYVTSWTSETEEGITLSLKLESNLESMVEYEKFNKVIKNIDKYIERIAYISNLNYYIGISQQTKIFRQEITKNIIDLLTYQYDTFKKNNLLNSDKRVIESIKNYGVSKEYLQTFVYELNNDIFVFSSKSTDKYQRLKINNLIIYILLMFLRVIDSTQIVTLDKIIKYSDFERDKEKLFGNLKIKINNGTDVAKITDYTILCYLMYYYSTLLIKNKLWLKLKDDENSQKIIINTMVDILNNILEQYKTYYLFELYATKFFENLYMIFNDTKNKDVILRLSGKYVEKTLVEHKSKPLQNIRKPSPLINFGKAKQIHYSLPKTQVQVITDNIYSTVFDDLYKIYNINGEKRSVGEIINNKLISKDEIEQFKKSLNKNRENHSKKFIDSLQELDININSNINKVLLLQNKVLDKFKNNNIDILIDKINNIIGNNININNENLYIYKNVYIIKFDYIGNKLKVPIVIIDGDKRLQFKRSDIYFKCNIYTFYDGKVIYYFHGTFLYLLGYKEHQKEIVNIPASYNYLEINYSIRRQFLYLGFNGTQFKVDKDIVTTTTHIKTERLVNLKNILIEIISIFNLIKNKKTNHHKLVHKYFNKFTNINISNKNEKIFENNDIINTLTLQPISSDISLIQNNEYLYIGDVKKIINIDNYIINYIAYNLNKLLEINSDKYTALNIASLIIDIIREQFNIYYIKGNSLLHPEVYKFLNLTYDYGKQELTYDDEIYTEPDEIDENVKDEATFEMDIDQEIVDELDADIGEDNLFQAEDI